MAMTMALGCAASVEPQLAVQESSSLAPASFSVYFNEFQVQAWAQQQTGQGSALSAISTRALWSTSPMRVHAAGDGEVVVSWGLAPSFDNPTLPRDVLLSPWVSCTHGAPGYAVQPCTESCHHVTYRLFDSSRDLPQYPSHLLVAELAAPWQTTAAEPNRFFADMPVLLQDAGASFADRRRDITRLGLFDVLEMLWATEPMQLCTWPELEALFAATPTACGGRLPPLEANLQVRYDANCIPPPPLSAPTQPCDAGSLYVEVTFSNVHVRPRAGDVDSCTPYTVRISAQTALGPRPAEPMFASAPAGLRTVTTYPSGEEPCEAGQDPQCVWFIGNQTHAYGEMDLRCVDSRWQVYRRGSHKNVICSGAAATD